MPLPVNHRALDYPIDPAQEVYLEEVGGLLARSGSSL